MYRSPGAHVPYGDTLTALLPLCKCMCAPRRLTQLTALLLPNDATSGLVRVVVLDMHMLSKSDTDSAENILKCVDSSKAAIMAR